MTQYSSSIYSFEDTYKTSYSHGLEKIYALENVDLRTVRKIEPKAPTPARKQISKPLKQNTSQAQLEFDFGPKFRTWMEPFLLREPIQVLALSKHAERRLSEYGKHTLKDLIDTDWQDIIFLKGLGQGHLDEIQQKLQEYISERSLQKSATIDFASWIKCLTHSLDRKKVYVCLQPFHLHELFSLSPSESVEVARLTLEKRQEWTQEVLGRLALENVRQSVVSDLQLIADAFIKPWMHRRQGLAHEHELLERLQRISNNASISQNALDFFSYAFFSKTFPLKNQLPCVDAGIHCADTLTAGHYLNVMEVAYSYFYKPHIRYTLSQIVMLLEREFAQAWQGFKDGFLERVLRLSPRFRVRKGIDGALEVRLA